MGDFMQKQCNVSLALEAKLAMQDRNCSGLNVRVLEGALAFRGQYLYDGDRNRLKVFAHDQSHGALIRGPLKTSSPPLEAMHGGGVYLANRT
jgi:hypothetical protein